MEKNMKHEMETAIVSGFGGISDPKIRCTILGVRIVRIVVFSDISQSLNQAFGQL